MFIALIHFIKGSKEDILTLVLCSYTQCQLSELTDREILCLKCVCESYVNTYMNLTGNKKFRLSLEKEKNNIFYFTPLKKKELN